MVEVERKTTQSRFDYALLDVNRETQIVVEAKSAGSDLSQNDTFMALVKYAFDAELENIFLTDGIHWHHFTEFKPGQSEPNQRLSIEDEDLNKVAVYFIQHLDAAKYWEEEGLDKLSQDIRQLRGELNTLKGDFVRTQESRFSPAVPDIWPKGSPEEQKFVPMSELTNLKFTKPRFLQLPDGSVLEVTTWTDILVQSCVYVLSQVNNVPIPLKDKAQKKINLLSNIRPPLGISYYEKEYMGNQIFIYTNYDSHNCVKNSLYILERLGKQAFEPAVVIDR
jgi:hypothetical protein